MLKKGLLVLIISTVILFGDWTISQDNTGSPESNVTYMSNQSLVVSDTTPKNAHIIFKDGNDKLYHIKYDSGSWTKTEVNDDGNYSSIAIDSLNKLYVGFVDDSDNYVKYTTKESSGSWQNPLIPNNDEGNWTKIALDSDKNIYITYSKNNQIKTIIGQGSTWQTKVLTTNSTKIKDIAVAMDSNNRLHIVYVNDKGGSNQDLNYTVLNSNFDITHGGVASGSIEYPSIAVNSAGIPHICYYDSINKDLNCTYLNGTSWEAPQIIDSSGDVGQYTSMAIDYNDKIFVSYYDNTNHLLKLATNETGSWSIYTISSGDGKDTGKYTSIKLTPNGYAYISYLNTDDNKTRLAYKLVSIPKAPTNLTATAEDNDSIKLTWTDNSNNENNFTIWRKKGSDALSFLTKTSNNHYTDTGLTANTEYHYEVNATNEIGVSGGTEDNATTLKTPPTAPSNITFSDINQTSVTINWTDNSNNEENFLIYKDGTLSSTENNDTTTKKITGLTQNTTYTFIVSAKNNGGENNSSSASVTTLKDKPTAPSDLNYTALSSSSIKLTWKDNSNNENNFTIYKDNIAISTLDTNKTTITGLALDTKYTFIVGAQNNGGENNSSSLDVNLSTNIPTAPTNLEANTTSSSSIKLGWNDNSTNEDGFYIYRKEGSGNFVKLSTTINSNTTVYEDTGLTANTQYTYIISAYNVVGENNSSQDDNTTYEAPPTAPSNVTFKNITTTTLDINWTDNSSNENNFTIYRNGNYNATVSANVTGIQITGLSEDQNYTFTVSAQNNGGESNVSANTATLPKAPTGVTATAQSSTEVKITWTNNSSTVTSFNIYRDEVLLSSGISPSATEYIDSNNLVAGQSYDYNVTAVNLGGERNSTKASVTMPDTLNAPSDLNYTALSSTMIKLTWTDNSNNETGFEVFKEGTKIKTTDANATTCIVENLTPNTTYLFEVRSIKADANSTKIHVVAKTPDVAPSAPTSLSGTAQSSSSIKITWTDASTNETGFKIYRNGTQITTVGEGITTFTDSGLSANTSYTYQVKATNSVGDSSAISTTVTTQDTVPTAPSSLSATTVTSSSVKLIWSDNSSNETGFRLYRNGSSIASLGAGTTTYTDSSLSANTSYTYELRAYNSVGDSSGTSIMVTTEDTLPTAPTNLSATAQSSTSIKLTWSDNSSNETGFRIYRDDNLIYIAGPNNENYTDTGLSPNHSYTYKVKATNSVGDSSAITATASTNDAPPPPPTNLSIIEAGSSSAKLTWNDASSNENGFKIYRNGTLIKTTTANTTSYTDTGLLQNTPYSYSITAYNNYGESSKISYGITLSGGSSYVGTKEDFVKRLYQNFLGREADTEGLDHWKEEFEQGKTATFVAKSFFTSEEFKNQINPNLTNEQYIAMLYRTMLNREPDLAGLQYWEDQIETKGKSRELIFYEFALSPEFYSLSQHYGVTSHNSDDLLDNFLDRMYYLVMTREPDTKGKTWWINQLKAKTKKARDIATGFFDSNEFRRRGYTDYNFITIAYRALLNREADMEGRDFWLKQLQKGLSRHDLVMNFISSDEFKSLAVKYGIDY